MPTSTSQHSAFALCLILLALAFVPVAARAGYGDRAEVIDDPMLEDPKLPEQDTVDVFHDRLLPLWLTCLDRPDADTRRRTADAIARAHTLGMPGLEATHQKLIDQLSAPAQHRLVRLSAARALITMDVEAAADTIWRRAQLDELAFVLMADPALARWDHNASRGTWLTRLRAPATPRVLRRSAIRALGTVREADAAPTLQEMVRQGWEDPPQALAAAKALGQIQPPGSIDLAEQLAGGSMPQQLAAVALLARHEETAATDLMLRLARSSHAAVIAAAAERLNEIDPNLLAPLNRDLATHGDPTVREQARQALVGQATPAAIALLGPMLDDVHPDIRQAARENLVRFHTQAGLRSAVQDAVRQAMERSEWRGLEQAALWAGLVDDEPSADRLLALCGQDRPEVRMAAAYALRRIDVATTYDRIHQLAEQYADKVAEEREQLGEREVLEPATAHRLNAMGEQLSQFFQLFGLVSYGQAEPLLTRFIPKDSPFDANARQAAIWTLGKIHAGEPASSLVNAFKGRLSDVNPMKPEATSVRRMAAISLGRMKARSALGVLRRFAKEEKASTVGLACQYAITRMTGETFPPLEPGRNTHRGWFIEPMYD